MEYSYNQELFKFVNSSCTYFCFLLDAPYAFTTPLDSWTMAIGNNINSAGHEAELRTLPDGGKDAAITANRSHSLHLPFV